MIGLIVVVIFVGIFVIGVYWISSRSGGGTHHDQKAREVHLRLIEQKRTQAEVSFRSADLQRRHRRWRRR